MAKTKNNAFPAMPEFFDGKVIINKFATPDSPGKWTFTIELPPGSKVDKPVFEFVRNRLETLDDLAAIMAGKTAPESRR